MMVFFQPWVVASFVQLRDSREWKSSFLGETRMTGKRCFWRCRVVLIDTNPVNAATSRPRLRLGFSRDHHANRWENRIMKCCTFSNAHGKTSAE